MYPGIGFGLVGELPPIITFPDAGRVPSIAEWERNKIDHATAHHPPIAAGQFAGVGGGAGVILKPYTPWLADRVTSLYGGLEMPHGIPKGSTALPRPGLGTLAYLLPEPIGVTPPEYLRIRPDYVSGTFKENLPTWLSSLLNGILGQPNQQRIDLYRAREAERQFLAYQLIYGANGRNEFIGDKAKLFRDYEYITAPARINDANLPYKDIQDFLEEIAKQRGWDLPLRPYANGTGYIGPQLPVIRPPESSLINDLLSGANGSGGSTNSGSWIANYYDELLARQGQTASGSTSSDEMGLIKRQTVPQKPF